MSSPQPRTFVLASRKSPMAQAQTVQVQAALRALDTSPSAPKFETSFMSTAGDKNQVQALYFLGGKELWTGDLEVALKERAADMLVHSLKDVPTVLPEGFVLAGISERDEPVDVMCVKAGMPWRTPEELPEGSVVGTSSVRRIAMLKRRFPHLKFLDVRGNIATRLAKLDDPALPYAALIAAKAGLVRVNLQHRITCDLAPPTYSYAVGQGALGIEVRADDTEALALCKRVTHWPSLWRCRAERACLRELEGGCSVPVGVVSAIEIENEGEGEEAVGRAGVLSLTAGVTSVDGTEHVQHEIREHVRSVEEAEALGVRMAKTLKQNGAQKILEDITLDRQRRMEEAQRTDDLKKLNQTVE
ncbi:porphobilinogen deaminase, dipyromethane cofactor binding domain-containing protein [Schizophyllum commune]